MNKAHIAVGLLAMIWLGMILAIGLESMVKFSTPTLTKLVAFDVGRVVFAAFNKVQLIMVALMFILSCYTKIYKPLLVVLIVLSFILFLQLFWLFPELSHRVDLLFSGINPPPTYKHGLYGMLEIIKAILLLLLGGKLLAFPKMIAS